MDNYELYINYIIRRNEYYKQRIKVEKMETELLSLKSTLHSSEYKDEIVSHSKSIQDTSSIIVKIEELDKGLTKAKEYEAELHESLNKITSEVLILEERYSQDKRTYKEKSIFYLFFYSDFKYNNRTIDYIAELIGITREHLQRLKKEYIEKVYNEISKRECNNKITISH